MSGSCCNAVAFNRGSPFEATTQRNSHGLRTAAPNYTEAVVAAPIKATFDQLLFPANDFSLIAASVADGVIASGSILR
jgi:hypothetical protein